MSDFVGWCVSAAIGVAVVAVAYFARGAAGGRRAAAPLRSDASPALAGGAVWGLLVPAVCVLLLSWLALTG
jgi:hypothetical protein